MSPPQTDKEATMNTLTKRTTVLIVAGLLVGNAAQAEAPVANQATPAADSSIGEQSTARARKANEDAASKAAAAVVERTRLDLDIRLLGPTSVKIAGDR